MPNVGDEEGHLRPLYALIEAFSQFTFYIFPFCFLFLSPSLVSVAAKEKRKPNKR